MASVSCGKEISDRSHGTSFWIIDLHLASLRKLASGDVQALR